MLLFIEEHKKSLNECGLVDGGQGKESVFYSF